MPHQIEAQINREVGRYGYTYKSLIRANLSLSIVKSLYSITLIGYSTTLYNPLRLSGYAHHIALSLSLSPSLSLPSLLYKQPHIQHTIKRSSHLISACIVFPFVAHTYGKLAQTISTSIGQQSSQKKKRCDDVSPPQSSPQTPACPRGFAFQHYVSKSVTKFRIVV